MTTRIVRTQVTGTSTKKFTLSAWVKKSSNTTGNDQVIFDNYASGSDRMTLYFTSSATLGFYAVKGGSDFNIVTNRVFRDVNAWYHIVLRIDTDQGNNAHRSRLYINGTEETSFGTASYATSGFVLPMGTSSYTTGFGWYGGGGSSVFDGCMSHLNFIDGEDRTPDYFGETDSTTGEWKIKTSISGVTYGNNGFFILKDGNSLTDQSGESNNFTLNTGTLTKTEDCPSNVFATLNPTENYYGTSTLSNGNNTQNQSSSSNNFCMVPSTLGFNSGKWYWEMKCVSNSSNSEMWYGTGITSNYPGGNAAWLGLYANDYGVYGRPYATGKAATYTGSTRTDQGTSFSTGDIVGVAVDCDNLAMYVHKNGVYMPDASNVTGVPTSGASRTGALYDITAPSSTTKGFYFPAVCYYDVRAVVQSVNFGNGYFGTTAVSSAGTNASNNGIFEYDVPSGFTALSTKGLNL